MNSKLYEQDDNNGNAFIDKGQENDEVQTGNLQTNDDMISPGRNGI